jgi:hypothetical protein
MEIADEEIKAEVEKVRERVEKLERDLLKGVIS